MKKFSIFLISVSLLWAMMKLLEKAEGDDQVFKQREPKISNQPAVGYENNEIASFLRAKII